MSEFQDDDMVMHEWYDHEKHRTIISFEFTDRALGNSNTAKWSLENLRILWTEAAKIWEAEEATRNEARVLKRRINQMLEDTK